MRTAESYLKEYNALTTQIEAFKRKLNKGLHHEEFLNIEEFLDIEESIIQKQTRKERVSQILADAFGMFQ